jgi:phosphoglycerate dehydrogenase-like enzyme
MIATEPNAKDTTVVRVVMVDVLEPRARALFSARMPDPNWRFETPVDAAHETLATLVHGASALITRRRFISEDIISAAGTGLRLIQIQGHLADRADLAAAVRAGIPVAVMPSRSCIAVAEHALALMLALARKIVQGHAGVVGHRYRERNVTPKRTSETEVAFNWLQYPDIGELHGKMLGIVGFGEIGQEVARRARAFGMRLLYYSRRPLPERFERELGVTRASLDDLLGQADYVTLHVPQTPETEQLLSRARLGLMKTSAYLVNTSRGAVVDEHALVEQLRHGRLAGAGLDVFVEEPLPAGHPLTTLDNVVLTPHLGSGLTGGQRAHAAETLDNIARMLRGEQPHNLVTGS